MPPVDLGALAPLLARDLSTIEDPPEWKTPPDGVYKWVIEKIELNERKVKDKDVPVIGLTYVLTDIIEQTEKDVPEHEQVKAGDKFGESFFFGDPDKMEDTISWMKARFQGLAAVVGSTDLLTIVQSSEGLQVKGIIGHRMDKTDKTKRYITIRDVVPAA